MLAEIWMMLAEEGLLRFRTSSNPLAVNLRAFFLARAGGQEGRRAGGQEGKRARRKEKR